MMQRPPRIPILTTSSADLQIPRSPSQSSTALLHIPSHVLEGLPELPRFLRASIGGANTEVDAIISLPPHLVPHINKALPRSFKAYAIPTEPLGIIPVPKEAVARLKGWLVHLKFNEEITSIVSDISAPQMRNDIRYLTGEDSSSPIMSRHSFSEDARIAANWLEDRIENTGARCELRQFLAGFAPNVVWYVISDRMSARRLTFSAVNTNP